jgi:hypothetical protein
VILREDVLRWVLPVWSRHLPYVLASYGVRAMGALVIGVGAATLARDTVGFESRADSVLFDPGGLMLSEVIRLHRVSVDGLLQQASVIALLLIPVGLVATCLLTASLASKVHAGTWVVVGRAIARFKNASVLYVLFTSVQAGVAWMVWRSGEIAIVSAHSSHGPRGSEVASALLCVVGVLGAPGAGVRRRGVTRILVKSHG